MCVCVVHKQGNHCCHLCGKPKCLAVSGNTHSDRLHGPDRERRTTLASLVLSPLTDPPVVLDPQLAGVQKEISNLPVLAD